MAYNSINECRKIVERMEQLLNTEPDDLQTELALAADELSDVCASEWIVE